MTDISYWLLSFTSKKAFWLVDIYQKGRVANVTLGRKVGVSSAGIPTIYKTPYRVLTLAAKF
jgi:hypothetical protein